MPPFLRSFSDLSHRKIGLLACDCLRGIVRSKVRIWRITASSAAMPLAGEVVAKVNYTSGRMATQCGSET